MARVEAACSTTGEKISITVDLDGIRELSPPGAVLSFWEAFRSVMASRSA